MSKLHETFRVPLKRTTTYRDGNRVRSEKSVKAYNIIHDGQLVTFVIPEPSDLKLEIRE